MRALVIMNNGGGWEITSIDNPSSQPVVQDPATKNHSWQRLLGNHVCSRETVCHGLVKGPAFQFGIHFMQRIAVPMIGGMVSSTLLTLIAVPAIFALAESTMQRAVSRSVMWITAPWKACAIGTSSASSTSSRLKRIWPTPALWSKSVRTWFGTHEAVKLRRNGRLHGARDGSQIPRHGFPRLPREHARRVNHPFGRHRRIFRSAAWAEIKRL